MMTVTERETANTADDARWRAVMARDRRPDLSKARGASQVPSNLHLASRWRFAAVLSLRSETFKDHLIGPSLRDLPFLFVAFDQG